MVRWAVWQGVVATLNAYCWAVDSADIDAFVDLYMPDGIHDDGIRRRVGQVEIHSLVAGVIQRYDATSHHLSNVEVTTNGKAAEAVASSHIYAWHRKAGQPDLEVWGQYRDRLCRSGGVWRFRERTLHVAGVRGLDRDPGFRRLSRQVPSAR